MPYQWVMMANGRSAFRKVAGQALPKRSDFPCPLIRSDNIAPVQSMADGKMYDSMSALRKTYRADGNPQGVEYQEIGDAPMRGGPPKRSVSKQEIADTLDKAEAMFSRGEGWLDRSN